mmetsp:Transcript_284/g.485  ORF Transcript_284/g.485 Transcript_284/m.485 type:complete len:414 (+) Transcript_284:192-1433(+)
MCNRSSSNTSTTMTSMATTMETQSNVTVDSSSSEGAKRPRAEEAEHLNAGTEPAPKKPKVDKTETESTDGKGMSSFSDKDVLSGRGGGTNLHPGNRFYRELILSYRAEYDESNKVMKPEISRRIVSKIRERGGRFLRKDADGLYYEIPEADARAKTSQALRHRTFELRNTKDPDRVRMNGRWKQQGKREDTEDTKSDSVPERKENQSPSNAAQMLPHNESNALSRPLILETAAMQSRMQLNDSKVDSAFLQEVLHRQRLMDNSMSSVVSDDSVYLNAIASLRHREAMLNLDKAIHEAQKRRYASMTAGSYPGGILASGLPHSALPLNHPLLSGLGMGGSSAASFMNPMGISNGDSIRERAALHASLLSGSQHGLGLSSMPSSKGKLTGMHHQSLKTPAAPSMEHQRLMERVNL